MPATKPEGDITAFVQTMPRRSRTDIRHKPFLGIDECLNRVEVEQLAIVLMQRGLIETSSPLWYETRSKDGEIVGTFLGGVSRDSLFRAENPFNSDIGVPVKYYSWSDFKVVQMLVVEFMDHDKVVLLSENTRNNEGGLRRLLKEVVGPALQERPEHLSLTALFKKGGTDISSYCDSVSSYFEAVNNERGYVEFLL